MPPTDGPCRIDFHFCRRHNMENSAGIEVYLHINSHPVELRLAHWESAGRQNAASTVVVQTAVVAPWRVARARRAAVFFPLLG